MDLLGLLIYLRHLQSTCRPMQAIEQSGRLWAVLKVKTLREFTSTEWRRDTYVTSQLFVFCTRN